MPLQRKVRLASEIMAAYARARWWLWRSDLPTAVAALRNGCDAQPAFEALTDTDAARIRLGLRLGRLVGRALGPLPADSRCLVQSLVLIALLSRRGIGSSLVVGVRSEPAFAAHAWVESSSVPLLPPGDAEYGRLVEL